MKSPVANLRKAYKDRLSALQFRGSGVRVIGKAQSVNPASPYVMLSTQTNVQDNSKTGFHNTSTILLQVVGIADQNISELPVDELADLILQSVIPEGTAQYLDLSPDFNLITTKLTSDNTIDESTDTNVYYRRLLRIEHEIEQL